MIILWSFLLKVWCWWWSFFVKGEIVISKLTKSSTGRDNSEFETSNFTTSSENILFLPKIFCPAKPGDAKEKIASVLEKLPCDCWKGKAATREPQKYLLGFLKVPFPVRCWCISFSEAYMYMWCWICCGASWRKELMSEQTKSNLKEFEGWRLDLEAYSLMRDISWAFEESAFLCNLIFFLIWPKPQKQLDLKGYQFAILE